jgi:hypothetical protein
MIKPVLFLLLVFSISCTRFKCIDQLSVGPTEKCQAIDENGIYYVKKCKTGKVCKEGTDVFKGQHYGVCIDFVLPNFVGDACAANEDCLSHNCDGSKCDEPKDVCYNDLQCDYGNYCDKHKTKDLENTYACVPLKTEGQTCYDDNECGKFKKCSFAKNADIGTCQRIGSIKKGNYASDPYLCEFGYLDDGICSEIKTVELCDYTNPIKFEDEYKPSANAKIDNGKGTYDKYVDCRYKSILDEVPYPYYSDNKCNAFREYVSILNEKYDDYDDDDRMWNYNDYRLHGNNKEIKKKLYLYQHPGVYAQYDNGNEDVDCVVDYLRQKDMNSSWIKINLLCLLFLCFFL